MRASQLSAVPTSWSHHAKPFISKSIPPHPLWHLRFECSQQARPDLRVGSGPSVGTQGVAPAKRGGVQRQPGMLTSSSRRRCSFCSSMRFWRSASSCRLCSSFSRCCCSSCCLRRASDRSLLASCSRRKSRRRVDSPGRFRMELWAGQRSQDPTRGKSNCYQCPRQCLAHLGEEIRAIK